MRFEATAACAAKWAGCGRIDEWIHQYLLGEGRNRALSDGLKLTPRYYIGILDIPAALFSRCCGPEEGMTFQVDPDGFRRKVDSLKQAILAHADLPPLIVHFADHGFTLSDGNHRFEAYVQLGAQTVPVVVWITEEDEYREFVERFGLYAAGAAVIRR